MNIRLYNIYRFIDVDAFYIVVFYEIQVIEDDFEPLVIIKFIELISNVIYYFKY